MAIMVSLTLRNVPIELFEEVNRELGASENPPKGLIVHFVHPVDTDGVRIVDVWASEQAHDAFDDDTDPPGALAGLLRKQGLGPPQFVSRDVVEVQALVVGSTGGQ